MDTLKKIDPFYWFEYLWESVFGEKKGMLYHIFEILYAFLVAVLIYAVMGFILNTPKPAVIVASKSMIPTLYPGDIAFIAGWDIKGHEVEYNGVISPHTRPEKIGITFEKEWITYNGRRIKTDRNGDIIVYLDDVDGKDIIHRVLLKIRAKNGYFYITKGDNNKTNPFSDQDCRYGFCVYPFLVPEERVYGKVIFVIPRIGIIKLLLFGEIR